jgi:hypothetical protein
MHGSQSQNGFSVELREGGYYSIVDGDRFAIAKVLKLEPDKVHVRIYKQHFLERPISINPSLLTLGTIHDPDGFGMGHLPLRPETFHRREPVFISESPVTASELEGYEFWRESGGEGVWE